MLKSATLRPFYLCRIPFTKSIENNLFNYVIFCLKTVLVLQYYCINYIVLRKGTKLQYLLSVTSLVWQHLNELAYRNIIRIWFTLDSYNKERKNGVIYSKNKFFTTFCSHNLSYDQAMRTILKSKLHIRM